MPVPEFIVPDNGLAPREGLAADAAAWQASMATGKVFLFKAGLHPTILTNKAALHAVNCDFDGYTATGVAVAALLDPVRQGDGSFLVMSPLVQINYVDGVGHVSNEVGGFWYEDADGIVRVIGEYAESVTCGSNDDAAQVLFGRSFA